MRVQAGAGEHVHDPSTLGLGVEHAVGGQKPGAGGAGQLDEAPVEPTLAPPQVALHLDVHVVDAKEGNESAQRLFRLGEIPPQQRASQRPFLVSGQADHAIGDLFQFIPAHDAFALRCPQLGAGQQSAKALVARRVSNQQRQHAAIFHRQLTTVDCPDAGLFGGDPEPGTAVEPIPVHHGERRKPDLCGAGRQRVGQRRRTQETKRAAGVQLHVGFPRRLSHGVKSNLGCCRFGGSSRTPRASTSGPGDGWPAGTIRPAPVPRPILPSATPPPGPTNCRPAATARCSPGWFPPPRAPVATSVYLPRSTP